jgi:hypothetical protein
MYKHYSSKQIQKAYKNYYCGMCFAMQHNYGQLSRFLISYDLMLIGLLMKSHEQPDNDKLRCFGQKGKKQQFANENWKKVAAINLLLTAGQLRDNIEDENSLIAKLFFRIFAKKIKKAQRAFPEVSDHITVGYDKMLSGEKANKSVIEISAEFSALMENVYRCIHSDNGASEVKIAYIRAVAGWLYFIDQLDDYDKDIKKGRMNPLTKNDVTGSDYIDKHFAEVLGLIRHYYQDIRDVERRLPKECVEDQILLNILLSTIPSMTAKVLNRSKPPKLQHFRDGTVWSNV